MAEAPNTPDGNNDDDNNDETPPPPPPPPAPAKDDGKDELPAELKAILDKERRSARDAEKRAKTAETELEKFRQAQKTEHEKAVDAARAEGLTEGTKQGNVRLLRAEVLAAASGRVADPEDVFAILSNTGALSDFGVDDKGEVDRAGLKTAIDTLLKTKPHLAASRAPEFGSRPSMAPAENGGDAGMDAWIRAQTGRR